MVSQGFESPASTITNQIKNIMETTNGVYLLIDNKLRQVREYNNESDAKVTVVYQGTAVVISPKNLGEARYDDAMKIAEANGVKLGNKPDWAIIDSQLKEANEALKLLGHDIINGEYWTITEFTSIYAWGYYSLGFLYHFSKGISFYVRPLSSFSLTDLL